MTRSPERTQLYADIITTAIEGGTGYWSAVSEYKWVGLDPADIYAVIHEFDEDEGDYSEKPLRVDIDVIAKGFNMLDKESRESLIYNTYMNDFFKAVRAGDWVAADFDADIADTIVQTGLFGTQVYG